MPLLAGMMIAVAACGGPAYEEAGDPGAKAGEQSLPFCWYAGGAGEYGTNACQLSDGVVMGPMICPIGASCRVANEDGIIVEYRAPFGHMRPCYLMVGGVCDPSNQSCLDRNREMFQMLERSPACS